MYVYFLEAFGVQALKRIKIGSSRHPEKRMAELQVGSPVRLRMLGTIKCRSDDHARQIEKFAHNIFCKQRRTGEWFHLSKQHLQQMKSLIVKAAETDRA